MTASRILAHAAIRAAQTTAWPPRRSFVAGDDRRRVQACSFTYRTALIAYGAELSTPTDARRHGQLDTAFSVIVDA